MKKYSIHEYTSIILITYHTFDEPNKATKTKTKLNKKKRRRRKRIGKRRSEIEKILRSFILV